MISDSPLQDFLVPFDNEAIETKWEAVLVLLLNLVWWCFLVFMTSYAWRLGIRLALS